MRRGIAFCVGMTSLMMTFGREASPGTFPGQFLAKMYTEALGRAPSDDDWRSLNATYAPCSLSALQGTVRTFYLSAEFDGLQYDDASRLLTLYRGALNREPDPPSFATRLAALQAGSMTWAQVVDDVVLSPEFAALALVICGADPNYFFGDEPVMDLPVTSPGLRGGTRAQLQRCLDDLSAAGGGTFYLAQRAVFRLDGSLEIPSNVTLTTWGTPDPAHYADMARIVREPRFLGVTVYVGKLAGLPTDAALRSVWVDGQKTDPEDYYTNNENVFILGGTRGTVSNCRVDRTEGWTSIAAVGFNWGRPCDDIEISRNLVTSYTSRHYLPWRPGTPWSSPWPDGISVSCEDTRIEDNVVVDAADVGVIIFAACQWTPPVGGPRFGMPTVTSPCVDQASAASGNTVLQAGNSIGAGLAAQHGDPGSTFSGPGFFANQVWGSRDTHADFGAAVGVREWNIPGISSGARFVGNQFGLPSQGGVPAFPLVAHYGVAVSGITGSTVQLNQLSVTLDRELDCPFNPVTPITVDPVLGAGGNIQDPKTFATLDNCLQPHTEIDFCGHSPTGVCGRFDPPPAGSQVQFTAFEISGSPVTSWIWDFGDGFTAVGPSATHTYTAPGSYRVALVGTTSRGPTIRTKYRFVNVSPPPQAAFSGTPREGVTAPLTVQFTDRSKVVASCGAVSWSWTFGDGGVSTLQNPSHTYMSAGVYPVSLTVTNGCGSDVARKESYVFVGLQTDFEATPRSGNAALPVAFFDRTLPCPETWDWDFGDGGSSFSQNPTHTYLAPGIYTVTLRTTTQGLTDTERKVDYIWVFDGTGATFPNFITGPGAALGNPPRFRGFFADCAGSPPSCNIVPTTTDADAYAVFQQGVNVAMASTRDPDRRDILTGPGPGAQFGPQVREFNIKGVSVPKVNFFAYGTLRYGVNVAGGDVDGDGFDEILTAPGPGAVFGPHIRGFNFDGVTVTAMSKLSFFAYGSLQFGAKVASTNFDLPIQDQPDEIVTGPGPGPTFSTQVRGFRFDSATGVSSVQKVNFIAYTIFTYGVNVAGANLDGLAGEDIVTGMPPGTVAHDSRVAAFGVDLMGTQPVSPFGLTGLNPVFPTVYGVNVGSGMFVQGNSLSQALAGQGPDPAAETNVTGIYADSSRTLKRMTGFDVNAYEFQGYTHGAKVSPGSGPSVVTLTEEPPTPIDLRLRLLVDFLTGIPDETFACTCCDEPLPSQWSEWTNASGKQQTVDLATAILDRLPAYGTDFARIVADLGDLRARVVSLVTNAAIRGEVVAIIDQLAGFYSPTPAFASTAVTAELSGFWTPDALVLSETSGKLYARDLNSRGTLQPLDVRRLLKEPDRPLSGSLVFAHAMDAPAGRGEVYAATTGDEHIFVEEPCKPPDPSRICGHFEFQQKMTLERVLPAAGMVQPDGGSFVFFRGTPSGVTFRGPQAVHVTPPGDASSLLLDTAYVSSGAGLHVIQDVSDFRSARVGTIVTNRPDYRSLVPSPVQGSDLLFALQEGGVDAIRTKAGNVVVEDVISWGPRSIHPVDMTSGTVEVQGASVPLLLVAFVDRVFAYDASTYELLDEQDIGDSVTDVHLSLDGRFILLTRYPIGVRDQTLVVLDAATRDIIRESTIGACPPGIICKVATPANPMALTIDGSHAVVSNPEDGELAYVYLAAPRAVLVGRSLETVVAAVPAGAFENSGARQRLLNDADAVVRFLALAEDVSDPAARQMLENALRRLTEMLGGFDGCASEGAPDGDDVVIDCAEQAGLTQVTGELASMVEAQMIESGCPKVVP